MDRQTDKYFYSITVLSHLQFRTCGHWTAGLRAATFQTCIGFGYGHVSIHLSLQPDPDKFSNFTTSTPWPEYWNKRNVIHYWPTNGIAEFAFAIRIAESAFATAAFDFAFWFRSTTFGSTSTTLRFAATDTTVTAAVPSAASAVSPKKVWIEIHSNRKF